jgi:hypothetical protein
MMYLFAPWTDQNEREMMWPVKSKKLESVNYFVVELQRNITVMRGYWFSAHETWKYLFLPYDNVTITHNLLVNGEKARTWDAYQNGIHGMFASVNGNISRNTDNMEYYSDCGIQSIAFQPVNHRHLVTPYSTMALFLANRDVASAWYHNMLNAPAGQNKYGSTEGTTRDGLQVSPMITWDAKITTVISILGGFAEEVSWGLKDDGVLTQLIDKINKEWSVKFPTFEGLDIGYALPSKQITSGRPDFTTCLLRSEAIKEELFLS